MSKKENKYYFETLSFLGIPVYPDQLLRIVGVKKRRNL
jgi:hypothetical protein